MSFVFAAKCLCYLIYYLTCGNVGNFREEFAIQNCILTSSGCAGSSTLAVPVPSGTPAHTESTALLADIRTIKINAS